MSYKHRQLTIQCGLIVFCILFLAVTRTEVIVNSQSSCFVPFYEKPPTYSWHEFENVAVRIDDSWEEPERNAFQAGIEKWNQANNCSSVTFGDYSSIHFENYTTAPPDWTLWWQRRSPVGVLYFFAAPLHLKRLRAAIVPIPANFQNTISGSYFVYLGTHETGHTFDLGDCLANNGCQAIAGTCSIMGGESQNPSFNTGGPTSHDNDSVDLVYCPQPCPLFCDPECFGCLPIDVCTYPDDGCPDGYYRPTRDTGCCLPGSPIVIDISGDGFNLTDAEHGVVFDLSGGGVPRHFAWTSPGSDDAWLVLDRNGNGTIDNGAELFGNFTPQPTPAVDQERNGFLALAEYDKSSNGGNRDGVISSSDTIFASLRLWQDSNHNGLSEITELKTLDTFGLTAIELDFKMSRKVDANGNLFRYRAKVRDRQGSRAGTWAWDVFLVSVP